MAVSDLTNTSWVINTGNIDSAVSELDGYEYWITFEAVNTIYDKIDFSFDDELNWYSISYRVQSSGNWVEAYGAQHWNTDMNIISITGGTDVTNATLISWFDAHATQQGGGSTAKTQVGTSTIAKKMFGTTPIIKEVVNGVTVYEAAPTPSGYSITITINEDNTSAKFYLRFYDGQDGSGTLLYESTSGSATSPLTLTSTTGYITITYSGAFAGGWLNDCVNCTDLTLGQPAYIDRLIQINSNNASCTLSVDYDD